MKPNLQDLLKQAQQMQAKLEQFQEKFLEKTITEETGGGLVKVTVNGKREIVELFIDKELINPEEKEMLEDLIIAAVNKALSSIQKMYDEEMANFTKGMIPPGLNIPGF